MIVLPDGKKVFPEDVERKLLAYPLVKDCMVLGQKTEAGEVVQAVLLLTKKTDVRKIIQTVNQTLEPHQQIMSYSVYDDDDFPRTHSLKVDRDKIRLWLTTTIKTGEDKKNEKETDKLDRLLSEICDVPVERIGDTADLNLDLKLNSLRRVELLAQIEVEYGVSIDESLLLRAVTVKELKNLITQGQTTSVVIELPRWPRWEVIIWLRELLQRIILDPIIALCCQLEIENQERLKQIKGPVLFIFNHESHLDALLIIRNIPGHLRRKLVTGAASDYWFSSRIKATLMQILANAIPVERKGSVKYLFEWLGELADDGWSILLAPEGTRSTSGKLGEFKQGAGAVAVLLGLPVVPMYLKGTGKVLPKGAVWPKRGRVKLKIGEPIKFKPQTDPIEATRIIENLFRKEVEEGN